MSWPHILSLSRVVASVPVAALVLTGRGNALIWAAVLFGAAALTDLLDGPLARRRTVGPFGIYLDTTGDKVLVSVVLIAMSVERIVDPWMTMVIVGREFLVSGVRSLAGIEGFVISANFAGKVKTTVTLVALFVLLLAASGQEGGAVGQLGHSGTLKSIGWFGMLLATGLTLYSGFRYLVDARPLFRPGRASAWSARGEGAIKSEGKPPA